MGLLVSFVCCLSILLGHFVGIESQKLDGNSMSLPNHGICYSTDVRNHPKYLIKLRNCSVIVGTLQIVLIDGNYNMSEYVFPELREVTQYVLLYRVQSMKSLGEMFPNLALIRGQRLFHNYALVIFEMSQLQEIGLRALTTIQRGCVRIDRNPQLCFTRTINWENITGKAHGHHLSENGNHLCPEEDACRGCTDETCWSAKNCQRIPSLFCHKECLGGCTNKGFCYRCKHYSDDGVCVPSCPQKKFIQPGSFECVTKEFCSKLYGGHGWTFENKCISHCPIGYETVTKNGKKTCLFCGDNCNITCRGAEIMNLEQAQALKGCHFVEGTLNIKMFGEFSHVDDVMEELEESLGGIREISGYLKVYRSSIITSLNFLKNLAVIHGNSLLYDRYAFIVHEMNNLQTLWNWDTKKNLEIKNGTLFFHHNPKLCVKVIHKLANITNVIINEHDVCSSSNGYKEACHHKTLKIDSSNIGQTYATITWERLVRPIPDNDRSVDDVGYLLYYFQNPDDDIETHIGIDSCVRNMWRSIIITESRLPTPLEMSYNITELIPYTRYAYYVQTYNKLRDRQGLTHFEDGQSEIKFFRTVMSKPPRPEFLEAVSYTNDSLTLFWFMPKSYTGIVFEYVVEMEIDLDGRRDFDESNFCEIDMQWNVPLLEPRRDRSGKKEKTYPMDCKCPDKNTQEEINNLLEEIKQRKEEELNTEDPCKKTLAPGQIGTFLDFIRMYRCGNFKKENEYELDDIPIEDSTTEKVLDRVEREIPIIVENEEREFNIHEMLNLDMHSVRPTRGNKTHNDKYHIFVNKFPGNSTNHTITNLRHYGYYHVYVAACIGKNENDCGPTASAAARTLPGITGDKVIDLKVVAINRSVTDFVWSEPKEPNAAIIFYTLQYIRLDLDHFIPMEVCITRKQHEKNNFKFTVWNLNPGPHATRIRASSLAYIGEYSDWVDFYVSQRVSTVVVLSLLGFFLAVACVASAVILYVRRKRRIAEEDRRALVRPGSRRRMRVGYRRRDNEEVEIYDIN
ncbi:insulin-like peptide receptor [Arctopsyche grandis]|uniref:insulin-like peptide receptor n=1 Tax=Arctopsyche grandis TaxID=121162 RepID=UPI00406D8B82